MKKIFEELQVLINIAGCTAIVLIMYKTGLLSLLIWLSIISFFGWLAYILAKELYNKFKNNNKEK